MGAAATARSGDANAAVIQQSLNAQPVFLTNSNLATTLKDMVRSGRHPAAGEVFPFLSGERDNYNGGQLHVLYLNAHAQFLAVLMMEGSASAKTVGAFDRILGEHEDRLNELLEADADALRGQRDSFDGFLKSARDRTTEIHAEVDRVRSSQATEWLEIRNVFLDQLKTETAVKLWSDRSEKHETRYRSFRKWTLYLAGGGSFVGFLWIFFGYGLAAWSFPTDSTARIASYTAGSVVLFTLFIWGLRVLIRSMISEDHLATDASARSALAHTYLALKKDNDATAEDRAIVLASLFAPVSDGLVKDDGMPILSPAALAAHFITGSGR